jgi:hypothetical protein
MGSPFHNLQEIYFNLQNNPNKNNLEETGVASLDAPPPFEGQNQVIQNGDFQDLPCLNQASGRLNVILTGV